MKASLNIAFVLAFFLVLISFFVATEIYNKYEINRYLDKNTSELIVQVKSAQNTYNLVSETIINQIINTTEVLGVYSKAKDADSLAKVEIRDSLYRMLLPAYKYLKDINIKQLHFHLPNNESFLRFHRPMKHGDNLTNYRYSVRMANSELKNYMGFEEGRIYNGFRYVFPLFYNNEHIGSVETSFSFEAVRRQIKFYANKNIGFMLEKEIVEKKVFKEEQKNYIQCSYNENYMYEKQYLHTLNDELNVCTEIDNQIGDKVRDHLLNHENFTVYQKTNNNYYLISFVEIPNVEGIPSAYIMAYQADNIIANYKFRFRLTLIIGLVLIPMFFVLMYMYISKKEKLQTQFIDLQVAQKLLKQNNNQLVELNNDLENRKIELENSEARWQSMINTSLAGVSILNFSGIHLYTNKTSEQIHGYKDAELIGNHFDKLVHHDDVELGEKILTDILENKKIYVDEQLRLIHKKTKKTVWIHVNASKYPKQSPTEKDSMLIIFQNITQQKKNEEKLKELNAAKDKFFSIIAHDLKSPFNSILGFSDMLQKSYDNFNDKERKLFIENINTSSKNAFKLIENLLTWARSQTNKIEISPTVLKAKGIVNENTKLLENSAKQKDLKLNADVIDCNIIGDENLLNTVLRNLISNAIKFTPRGGEIKISSELDGSGNLVFSVTDSGIGIPAQQLNGLFKVEENTSTNGTEDEQGTGLGLILCKEFIEKMNGEIWVESDVGKGTSFSFTIPIDEK